MATLIPVDHDPFASNALKGAKLVPVDHDPFSPAGNSGFDAGRFDLAASAGGNDSGATPYNLKASELKRQYAQTIPDSSVSRSILSGAVESIPFGQDAAAALAAAVGGGAGANFSDRYQDRLAKLRAIAEADAAQHPVANIGGQIGMAVAALPTFGLAGNTIKGGAALGGAYGALSGASQGNDIGDRAKRAFGGALTGAALGGAASGVIGSAGAAYGAARNALSPVFGAVNPEAEAARRVVGALQRDTAIGQKGLLPEEFAAARNAGMPVAVVDTGGEATRALARSSANTSPEARSVLTSLAGDRFSQQSQRLARVAEDASPLGAVSADTLDILKSQAAKLNAPAYQKAFAKGEAGVWDQDLAGLTQAPAVVEAIKDATRTGANKAVLSGFRPIKNPFTVSEDGAVVLTPRPDGSTATPTLQFWDTVKQNLDSQIGKLKRAGDDQGARDVISLKQDLVTKLDAAVPEYSSARKGAAAYFDAQDALEAGQKFLMAKGQNRAYAKAISGMNDAERTLFREGFASELRQKLLESSDRRDILSSVYNSPNARERIEMALGKEGAAAFKSQIHIEGIMDGLRKSLGNSSTARQLVEIGVAGGIGGAAGFGVGGDLQSASVGSVLGALARKGLIKIDARVAENVGKMLSSNDPALVQKLAKQAARQPGLIKALDAIDEGVAKVSGQQVSSAGSPAFDMMGKAIGFRPVAADGNSDQFQK